MERGPRAGRAIIALGTLLVGLAACGDPEARRAAVAAAEAAQARQDDSLCQSYGVPPGTGPYVQCRMQLTALRAQQVAQEQALIQQRSAVMMQTGAGMMMGR